MEYRQQGNSYQNNPSSIGGNANQVNRKVMYNNNGNGAYGGQNPGVYRTYASGKPTPSALSFVLDSGGRVRPVIKLVYATFIVLILAAIIRTYFKYKNLISKFDAKASQVVTDFVNEYEVRKKAGILIPTLVEAAVKNADIHVDGKLGIFAAHIDISHPSTKKIGGDDVDTGNDALSTGTGHHDPFKVNSASLGVFEKISPSLSKDELKLVAGKSVFDPKNVVFNVVEYGEGASARKYSKLPNIFGISAGCKCNNNTRADEALRYFMLSCKYQMHANERLLEKYQSMTKMINDKYRGTIAAGVEEDPMEATDEEWLKVMEISVCEYVDCYNGYVSIVNDKYMLQPIRNPWSSILSNRNSEGKLKTGYVIERMLDYNQSVASPAMDKVSRYSLLYSSTVSKTTTTTTGTE